MFLLEVLSEISILYALNLGYSYVNYSMIFPPSSNKYRLHYYFQFFLPGIFFHYSFHYKTVSFGSIINNIPFIVKSKLQQSFLKKQNTY